MPEASDAPTEKIPPASPSAAPSTTVVIAIGEKTRKVLFWVGAVIVAILISAGTTIALVAIDPSIRPDGPTGDIGPQGPRGEAGPPGKRGKTGAQGEQGATGASGGSYPFGE